MSIHVNHFRDVIHLEKENEAVQGLFGQFIPGNATFHVLYIAAAMHILSQERETQYTAAFRPEFLTARRTQCAQVLDLLQNKYNVPLIAVRKEPVLLAWKTLVSEAASHVFASVHYLREYHELWLELRDQKLSLMERLFQKTTLAELNDPNSVYEVEVCCVEGHTKRTRPPHKLELGEKQQQLWDELVAKGYHPYLYISNHGKYSQWSNVQMGIRWSRLK